MPGPDFRFGITTPRASGIAVRRNRFKRLLREVYRVEIKQVTQPGSLLVLLKRTDDETGLTGEFLAAAERAVHNANNRARRSGA